LIAGYEKLAQIGVGARSTIYKVVERTTGRIYALKHVVRGDDEDDRYLAQAEIGFAVSSRMEHPNLRRSYSIRRVRKWTRVKELYVLMEYVEGMTFEQARPNRLDWFLQIVRKVAAGLDALHEAGYVHADVKPNNVILGPNGVVKIIDFGQSCPIGHRKQRIQGTPDYIAPEQVHRMPLERTTDVFNLGATMYWALTDAPFPTDFRAPARGGSIDLVTSKDVLAPKELNPKIPAVLSQLVMDCCRPNPAERPANMKHVQARLEVVQRMWRKQRLAYKAKVKARRGGRGAKLHGLRSPTEQADE
jgi:serine/threonine-protein kinase